jgi:Zn-dependent peptidase ImmA (M78 family)
MKLHGLTHEQLAVKKLITPEQVRNWENRIGLPTHPQAEKLAERLGIPFLVLFLSKTPDLTVDIPDLRTVAGMPVQNASPDFLHVINDALVRQDWYRDLRRSKGEKPFPFVGSYSLRSDIRDVAAEISNTIGIPAIRQSSHSWREFLNNFVDATERLGVPVFRSALVRHATRKKLQVKEFRGFVLSDPLAPLVFINDDDAKAAQIFTLAHELAHIWIGESGISDPDLRKRSEQLTNSIERFCNRVAAELLVPARDFRAEWRNVPTRANVERLAAHYRVSSLVVLIRAHELRTITEAEFRPLFDAEEHRFRLQDHKDKREEVKKKKKGGNFWASFSIRNSREFTNMVVSAVKEGYSRYTDAASLLGVRAPTLERYIKRLEA